ncbi:hypothetical protein H4R33_002505 [Dimargaris cristalligena]|nr:hypothetical protein H4R33_002505 [Dimargaris cristalligena]
MVTDEPTNDLAVQVAEWVSQELGLRQQRQPLLLAEPNRWSASDFAAVEAQPLRGIFQYLLPRTKGPSATWQIRKTQTYWLTQRPDDMVQSSGGEKSSPLLLTKYRQVETSGRRNRELNRQVQAKIEQNRLLQDQIQKMELKLAQARQTLQDTQSGIVLRIDREHNLRRQVHDRKTGAKAWVAQDRSKNPPPTSISTEALPNRLAELVERLEDWFTKHLDRRQASQSQASDQPPVDWLPALIESSQRQRQWPSPQDTMAYFQARMDHRRSMLDRWSSTDSNEELTTTITLAAEELHRLHQHHIQRRIQNITLQQRIRHLQAEWDLAASQYEITSGIDQVQSLDVEPDALWELVATQTDAQAHQMALDAMSALIDAEGESDLALQLSQTASEYAVSSRKAKAATALLNLKMREIQALLLVLTGKNSMITENRNLIERIVGQRVPGLNHNLPRTLNRCTGQIAQELAAFASVNLVILRPVELPSALGIPSFKAPESVLQQLLNEFDQGNWHKLQATLFTLFLTHDLHAATDQGRLSAVRHDQVHRQATDLTRLLKGAEIGWNEYQGIRDFAHQR